MIKTHSAQLFFKSVLQYITGRASIRGTVTSLCHLSDYNNAIALSSMSEYSMIF